MELWKLVLRFQSSLVMMKQYVTLLLLLLLLYGSVYSEIIAVVFNKIR